LVRHERFARAAFIVRETYTCALLLTTRKEDRRRRERESQYKSANNFQAFPLIIQSNEIKIIIKADDDDKNDIH
jgi:hypothetical protein